MQWADADGAGSAPWKLTNRYLYGEAVDLVLADEQLPNGGIGLTSVSYTTGNVLWPLFDQLGSVRDVVDSNGVIRQHLVFDSFGNRLSETDYNTSGVVIPSSDPAAVDELFGYTGREWDKDVGLQYNRARWYDPALGRWLSQDPIGLLAGDANWYRYVGNLPTAATDPSGLVDDYVWMPPGHHWVPWEVTSKNLHRLTDGAVSVAIAYTSGRLDHRHGGANNKYGGITHPRYNELVADELDKFYALKKKRYLSGDDMLEFAELIRQGKGANGREVRDICKFNEGVAQHRQNYLDVNPQMRGERVERDVNYLRKRGRELKSHPRFGDFLAGLGMLTFVLGQLDTAVNAQEVLESQELRLGLEALTRGDLAQANVHFVGGKEFGQGGFAAVLSDKGSGYVGMAFSHHYSEVAAKLGREAKRRAAQMNACQPGD